MTPLATFTPVPGRISNFGAPGDRLSPALQTADQGETEMKLVSVVTACVAAIGLAGQTAQASFHLMQVEQVIGGVNGDTTAQAIQLRMRSSFQNQMQASRLWVRDATGANPILIASFPGPVSNFSAGARVLITSENFENYTSPALVTDKQMDALIPASYLAAGSLTFEDIPIAPNLPTVYWRVSWGGAAYSGTVTGSTTNDANGSFGKLTTPMQTSNLQAFRFVGAFSALSTANETDYVLSATPAIFTNNAGTNFTVIAGSVPADGDLDGSGSPNGRDIRHFVECVTTGSTSGGSCGPGDFNNSGGVDAGDVTDFVAALLAA